MDALNKRTYFVCCHEHGSVLVGIDAAQWQEDACQFAWIGGQGLFVAWMHTGVMGSRGRKWASKVVERVHRDILLRTSKKQAIVDPNRFSLKPPPPMLVHPRVPPRCLGTLGSPGVAHGALEAICGTF